jgi:hypothetical protein
MKTIQILVILFLLLVDFIYGQSLIISDSKYKIGDTIVEVRSWKEFNLINEFKKVKGTEVQFYKEYYLDTKMLKEEGVFKDGWRIGIWKYFNEKGQLEKEINYDNNVKTLYITNKEPYDEVFENIRSKADSLIIARYGRAFFLKYIIQNTNRSFYYNRRMSGTWFEVPNFRPNKYLLRYDIKHDNQRFSFLEFTLDSIGSLKYKNSIQAILNLKNDEILHLHFLDSIALQNGLTIEMKPFKYLFQISSDSVQRNDGLLEFHIIGKPFKSKMSRNEIEDFYFEVVLDPWTGKFIRKETNSSLIIID